MKLINGLFAAIALVSLLSAGKAQGHDGWLEPSDFNPSAGELVDISLQIGHGAERRSTRLDSRLGWVRNVRVIAPDGTPIGDGGADGEHAHLSQIRLEGQGTYVFALSTYAFTHEMAASPFNEYLRDEGLTDSLAHRVSSGSLEAPGREIYHRIAKLLLAGNRSGNGSRVQQPLGLDLELVTLCDPVAGECGDSIPVRLFYYGRPLAGVRVVLNNLGSNDWPSASAITSQDGTALFENVQSGNWMISTIWSRPVKNDPRGEYASIFSSLTFTNP